MENEEYVQPRSPLRRPIYQAPIPPKIERIGKATGFALIGLAFFIDCMEMLLEWLGIGLVGVSTLISICTTLLFWIIFKIKGIPFTGKPKNLRTFGGTAILEIIPALDALGGFIWTIGIWALVGKVMEEDGQSGIIVTVYQNTLKKIGL